MKRTYLFVQNLICFAAFALSFFFACSDKGNEEKVQDLQHELNALKQKNILDTISDRSSAKMGEESSYKIGDSETKVVSIQGAPSYVDAIGSTKIYFYGFSSLVFERGILKSYNNGENNLKIMVSTAAATQEDKTRELNTSRKFCYVVVHTNEPELKSHIKIPEIGVQDNYSASPRYFTYKSSVIEIDKFSEDNKYKVIDHFEQEVTKEFTMKDHQLDGHGQCEIISSDCYLFNTYKAASEHRRNH